MLINSFELCLVTCCCHFLRSRTLTIRRKRCMLSNIHSKSDQYLERAKCKQVNKLLERKDRVLLIYVNALIVQLYSQIRQFSINFIQQIKFDIQHFMSMIEQFYAWDNCVPEGPFLPVFKDEFSIFLPFTASFPFPLAYTCVLPF